MKVYILLGCIPYEGEQILGVFGSRESAEAARLRCVSNEKYCDDYRDGFEIEEHDVL